MSNEQVCPKCKSENTYQDMNLQICSECFYEWDPSELTKETEEESQVKKVIDSNGNTLNNGDAVTVIKDLKARGSSLVVKCGTKVRNICLIDGHDGHNISCKIEGLGAMELKSEFVKKV